MPTLLAENQVRRVRSTAGCTIHFVQDGTIPSLRPSSVGPATTFLQPLKRLDVKLDAEEVNEARCVSGIRFIGATGIGHFAKKSCLPQ